VSDPFTDLCALTLAWLDNSIEQAKTERVRKADIAKLEGALGVLLRLVSEGNK